MTFSGLAAQVRGAPSTDFWFWVCLTGLAALCLLILAQRALSRARLIEDTPTSRIRSAAQGYVELIGTADTLPGPEIVAPLTQVPCVWYSYRIEERRTERSGGRQRSRWATVETGVSTDLFLIRDGTGECVIDPEGAQVTPSGADTWYGSTRRPAHRPTRPFLSAGAYRYTERRLLSGDPLYAIGHFETHGHADRASVKDDVAALLRLWKRRPEDYLRAFDANGDGTIDIEEWEAVRRAAELQVARERAAQAGLPTMHLLRRGPDRRRPFLLSATPQPHLARSLRLRATASLTAGVILALACAWLLLARFAA